MANRNGDVRVSLAPFAGTGACVTDRSELGFSLVEVVIGGAIAVFVLLAVLAVTNTIGATAARLNARVQAQSAADRLTERLSTEATAAWAVFVPASDVLGNDNADGHEIDLFSEDGAHRPYASAYTYDQQTKLVTRYAYAPGIAPAASETIGPLDTFAAAAADVTDLANPSSAAYDALFATATAPVVHFTFAAMPGAVGGNGVVHVHLVASGVDRTAMLASATAPTTFTVVIPYTPPPASATSTPAPLPTWSWTPGP